MRKPSIDATRSSTRSPSRTTSGPMPSPGTTAIGYDWLMSVLSHGCAAAGRLRDELEFQADPDRMRRPELDGRSESPGGHCTQEASDLPFRERRGREPRKVIDDRTALLVEEQRQREHEGSDTGRNRVVD